MIPLIQHITADNQVKTAQFRRGFVPGQVIVVKRLKLIQRGVVIQKALHQRVVVAGGDVGAPLLKHQAGQTQTATDFQNLATGDIHPMNGLGQGPTSRPELTEQRPGGRGNSGTLSVAFRIRELLMVQQGLQAEQLVTDADFDLSSLVTWHEPLSSKAPLSEARGGNRYQSCNGN